MIVVQLENKSFIEAYRAFFCTQSILKASSELHIGVRVATLRADSVVAVPDE